MRRKPQQRRGVLLLVVLSMLVVFVLIAITFVMVASQQKGAAKAASRMQQTGNDPRRLLDGAMYQLLRDTTNPQSVVRGHSLLRDLYGDDYVVGTLASPAIDVATTGKQMIEFQIASPPPWNYPLSPIDNYYAGCVISAVNGAARGVSARIVTYKAATHTVRVMRPASDAALAPPAQGDRFVINGRPFNGTGFGYDPLAGKLNAPDNTGRLIALLPNHRSIDYALPVNAGYLAGGADESYDAPDYQNMALGALVPDAANPNVLQANRIIPSFHRRALINYWTAQTGNPLPPDLLRKVVLRPNATDNPHFPALTSLVTGPWDVDNDGDGVADSVWLDLGYPATRAQDGRLYKPLFAILCLDMDGKFNLNAHGNRWQYAAALPQSDKSGSWAGAPAPPVPRGQGYGPPEINMGPAPGGGLFTAADYAALLDGANGIAGRYGLDKIPGQIDNDADLAWVDNLTQIDFFEYPTNYFTGTNLSAFSSPPDLRGTLAVGLDYRGRPVFDEPTATDVRQDTPYDEDLSRKATRGVLSNPGPPDMPFGAVELERLLRVYDADAGTLPDRLLKLVTTFSTTPNAVANRRIVTTDSYDLPVPNVVATENLKDAIKQVVANDPTVFPKRRALSVADLLRARLMDGGFGGNMNVEVAKMLVPDLMRGLRMDINRPFGNGRDDNNNGVVDEPAETAIPEQIWQNPASPPPVSFQGKTFNYLNDDAVITAPALARQILARQLYVLMMLLKDKNANIDFDGDSTNNSAAETARGIAQWAINAVDFRDADSIMTAFEYDEKPFDGDGWSTDGDLTTTSETNRGVVWGCERPELLITETLAFHDRRTEDRDDAGATDEYSTVHTPAGSDVDFDQRLRPRSGLFVELYNPWQGSTAPPGEFYYDESAGAMRNGVLLNKVNAAGAPVWRLIVVKGVSHNQAGEPKDPDEVLPRPGPFVADIERTIFFVDPAGVGVPGTSQAYFSDLPVAPLLPGRYAVVGTADAQIQSQGGYFTPIGFRTDAVPDNSAPDLKLNLTRGLVLSPNVNPATNQFQVVHNGGPNPEPSASAGQIDPVIAVAIDRPQPLSITEPTAGYPATVGGSTLHPDFVDHQGAYDPPVGTPLDQANDPELMKNQTIRNYRTIHLQRLANPLAAWDAVTNPYLTVDTASVNVTAFNGVSDIDDPGSGSSDGRLGTLERGNQNDPTPNAHDLWRNEPSRLPAVSPAGAGDHFFDWVLQHSLGYLNKDFGPTPSVAPGSTGDPATPFPWLTWNNRPYVSQLELLQVPKSRSSRLPYDFTMTPAGAEPRYDPTDPRKVPFQHLLNFFFSPTAGTDKMNFSALFDLLRVPSRFVSTDTVLNPATFVAGAGTETLHPPFNRISNYRDPGRVNINTVFDPRVWQGIKNGHSGPTWNELVDSRRGYSAGAPGSVLAPDPSVPTYFANPFRAFGAGDLMPLPALERPGVECTLLRSNAIKQADAPSGTPLFPPVTPAPYNNPDRNPYFRYEGLQRLGNLVTTRSNVYAVWITVGYFEVEPNPATNPVGGIDPAHPDGYALAQELGSDTGDVHRHRAFYMIDRSIPVAFEPGVNNNVDRAILLRRFIE